MKNNKFFFKTFMLLLVGFCFVFCNARHVLGWDNAHYVSHIYGTPKEEKDHDKLLLCANTHDGVRTNHKYTFRRYENDKRNVSEEHYDGFYHSGTGDGEENMQIYVDARYYLLGTLENMFERFWVQSDGISPTAQSSLKFLKCPEDFTPTYSKFNFPGCQSINFKAWGEWQEDSKSRDSTAKYHDDRIALSLRSGLKKKDLKITFTNMNNGIEYYSDADCNNQLDLSNNTVTYNTAIDQTEPEVFLPFKTIASPLDSTFLGREFVVYDNNKRDMKIYIKINKTHLKNFGTNTNFNYEITGFNIIKVSDNSTNLIPAAGHLDKVVSATRYTKKSATKDSLGNTYEIYELTIPDAFSFDFATRNITITANFSTADFVPDENQKLEDLNFYVYRPYEEKNKTTGTIIRKNGKVTIYAQVNPKTVFAPDTFTFQIIKDTSDVQDTLEPLGYTFNWSTESYTITIPAGYANATIKFNNTTKKNYYFLLPKKIAGIEKMEYRLRTGKYNDKKIQSDWVSFGSVAGKLTQIMISYDSEIDFQIKFTNEGYRQLDLSNVKINLYSMQNSQITGMDPWPIQLNLCENDTDRTPASGSLGDSINIFFSENFTFNGTNCGASDVAFGIDELPLDIFDVIILPQEGIAGLAADKNFFDILNICRPSDTTLTTIDYESKKAIKLTNSYGTFCKFWYKFTTTIGASYNQSSPIFTVTNPSNNQPKIFYDIDDSCQLKITGNTILQASGLELNTYTIEIDSPSGLDYSYRTNTGEDFQVIPNKRFILTDGDNLTLKAVPESPNSYDWDITTLEYKFNGTKISDEMFTNEENSIKCDFGKITSTGEISAKISKNKYKLFFDIDLPNDEKSHGYQIAESMSEVIKFYDSADSLVSKTNDSFVTFYSGSNYQFKFKLDYKYNASAQNLMVYYIAQTDGDKYAPDITKSNIATPTDQEIADAQAKGKELKMLLTANNGIYTVPPMMTNGKILVEKIKLNRYTLTFKNTLLVTFTDAKTDPVNIGNAEDFKEADPTITIKQGENFLFNTKLSYGYTLDNSAVTANGIGLKLYDGHYELNEISENITIEVKDINKVLYKVIFPTDDPGIYFANAAGAQLSFTKVLFNENFEIKAVLDEKYSQSARNFLIYAVPESELEEFGISSVGSINLLSLNAEKKETLNTYRLNKEINGNYIASNVQESTAILYSGVERNIYHITLPYETEGITFKVGGVDGTAINADNFDSELCQVEHGEAFNFDVIPVYGYDTSAMTISDKKNFFDVLQVNNGYSIQNVSDDISLNVFNVKLAEHNILFKGSHITFKQSTSSDYELKNTSISHGSGTFTFVIIPHEGYKEQEGGFGINISPANIETGEEIGTISETTGDNGEEILVSNYAKIIKPGLLTKFYTVTNVSRDIVITVSGAEIKTFNVTLPTNTLGIKFFGSEGELKHNNVVSYAADFTFEVRPDYGFDASQIKVSIGIGKYIGPTYNVYILNAVKEDITISVENVLRNKYIVRFKGENMTFYDADGRFPQSEFENEYESSISFRIIPNHGYTLDLKNDLTFSVDENEEKVPLTVPQEFFTLIREGDLFTVSNIRKSLDFVADGTKKQIFNITIPIETEGIRFKTLGSESLKGVSLNDVEHVEYLSGLGIEISPKKGYDISNITLTCDPPEHALIKYVNGYFALELNEITGDMALNVTGVIRKEYDVKFKGTGAIFYNTDGVQISNTAVPFGHDFVFSIEETEGYEITNGYTIAAIIENGEKKHISNIEKVGYSETFEDGEDDDGNVIDGTKLSVESVFKYRISNVQGPTQILIEDVAKNEYNVSFLNIEGINYLLSAIDETSHNNKVTNLEVVKHGGSIVFAIKELTGFSIKNITVTANLYEIPLVDGKYTINNITADTNVNVEGVVPTKIKIKLNYVSGLQYLNVNDEELSTLDTISIDHSSTFNFKVALIPSYTQSLDKIKVIDDEENEIVSSRGIYSLPEVSHDVTISVLNVEINTYKINFEESVGANYMDKYGETYIIESPVVKFDESFGFMVEPKIGYNLNDLAVYATPSGEEKIKLTAIDGVYTVFNVKNDYIIVVEDFAKIIYKLELRIPPGANCIDENGNVLSGNYDVRHGSNFKFILSLDESYNHSVPVIKTKNSNNPIPNIENTYTVKNITSDTIVEFTGIKKNTYEIKFKETEGVVYRDAKNKPIEDFAEIEYGGVLNFKVTLKDAYNDSIPIVYLNNEVVLTEDLGFYELKNIRNDSEITVKYVKKDDEEISMESIAEISIDKILTDTDAEWIVKISRFFNNLSDEDKKLVTNANVLQEAQEVAGKIHHQTGGVVVSGIDWNIKVLTEPLKIDEKAAKDLEQIMERKTLISLYKISLIDALTEEKYEVPYGQKVTVVIPMPELTGFKNKVVVHQKNSGSIEYLDVYGNEDGNAMFETTSFSLFGLAAKNVPNYVDETSGASISIEGLYSGNDAAEKIFSAESDSLLGDLKEEALIGSDIIDSTSDDSNKKSFLDNVYEFALNNEFIITATLILIFLIWIFAVLLKNEKKFSKPSQ